jgi:REP element-mobilizing transposase RayT
MGTDEVGEKLTIKRRFLPHWQAGGSTYFITFSLKGHRVRNSPARTIGSHGSTGFQPVPFPGPTLSEAERRIVRQDILFCHEKKWTVHIFTVMPDHVHILATPLQKSPGSWFSLSDILHSVKFGSALKINRLRGVRGALWQRESYDRIVRDAKEFDEKAGYILENASRVGLVDDGWDWDGFWSESKEEMDRRKS